MSQSQHVVAYQRIHIYRLHTLLNGMQIISKFITTTKLRDSQWILYAGVWAERDVDGS